MKPAVSSPLFAGIVSLCLLHAGPAHASQELGLEELLEVNVAGASRYAQPLAETPSTASVVTARDIERFGLRDLGEALETTRGVYVTRNRAVDMLGVRGFGRPGDSNARILLLQDGARLNEPIYDAAPIGNSAPIEMEWIKQLEFVPGPSSAGYGSNALFGIAHAVLWSGADINGNRLRIDAGSGRMGRISSLSGGYTEDGLDWLAALSVYGSRGDNLYFSAFDSPATSNGIAHHLDSERYVKGLLKGRWQGWRASFNFAQQRKSIPTAYYGTDFDTPGNFVAENQYHLDLSHTRQLASNLEEQVRAHFGRYGFDAEYPYSGLINRDETRADWWHLEYQLSYTGWKNHRLLSGVEFRRNRRLTQKNFDIEPAAEYLNISNSTRSAGFFVQDEWRFAQKWIANLGLRVDSKSASRSMTSPRGALIYRPVDEASIKLLYGRAFRYANDFERHYHDGFKTQKPGLELRPERITTHEISADYAVSSSLRVGIGYYRNTIRDLIDMATDPADGLVVYRNQGKTHAHGVETEAELLFGKGWRIRGSLAAQEAKTNGGELGNSPHRLGKLLLDGPLNGNWTLGLNLQSISARKTLLGNVPGYVSGNLTLRQSQMGPTGLWALSIYNVSGKRHLVPASNEYRQDALPLNGRQLRLSWSLGF